MNPYDRLDIPADADDAAVRDAYLAAVKRYPPEQCPETFAAIHDAYQRLKDEESRLRHLLFDRTTGVDSPMEAVLSHFRFQAARTPPDYETLKRRLRRYASR